MPKWDSLREIPVTQFSMRLLDLQLPMALRCHEELQLIIL